MIARKFCHGVPQFLTAICLLMVVTMVRAHLIAAQHGTVNFTNGGAFLVLSVPVSALNGVDDDGDGALSAQELSWHTSEIERQLYDGVQLLDDSGGLLPLQGLLLSLTSPENAPTAPARQLVALGRFLVDVAVLSPGLRITLRGETSEEQRISITATRDSQSQVMEFTPDREYHTIFPHENLEK